MGTEGPSPPSFSRPFRRVATRALRAAFSFADLSFRAFSVFTAFFATVAATSPDVLSLLFRLTVSAASFLRPGHIEPLRTHTRQEGHWDAPQAMLSPLKDRVKEGGLLGKRHDLTRMAAEQVRQR